MARFPFASLRARLVLLVLLALLPAFGLALYGGIEQRRLATREAQDDAQGAARLAATGQAQLTESARQLLIALAQFRQVRSGDPAACSNLLASLLKQYPVYANLGVIDLNGNVFCSAVPFREPVNLSDRTFFQQSLQTRGFAVGEYQAGRITGLPSLSVSLPVLDESGEIQSVVYASLNLTWFNQLASEAQLPPGSVLNVTDRNHTILARYPDSGQWIGKTLPEASIVQAIESQQGEGTAEAAGFDGVARLYAFVPLRDVAQAPNEYVSVGIPSAVAYAEANQSLVRNLLGLGLVAALAVAAAWFLGDVFIVRRVNALVGVTEQLSAGKLSARTGQPHGGGELDDLARRIDEMAAALQEREIEREESEAAKRNWLEIYQNTQMGIIICGPDASALDMINPAFASMHGYTVDELSDKILQDVLAPDAYAQFEEQINILRERGHHVFESKQRRKDGSLFPALIDLTAVRDAEGQLLYFIASVQDISELRRAEQAEREQRNLAEALRDTAAALNSTLNFDEVLDRILDNVGRVVPHDTANVMLLEAGVARVVGSRGLAAKDWTAWLSAQRFPLADFPHLRQMFETGNPYLSADTHDDPLWIDLPEERWIRSDLGIPIRTKDQVIGFLTLDSATPGFFDETHAARLEVFADQAAIALENARLLTESEKRASQFSALYDIARELATQRDVPALLQTIVDRAIALFNVPCGFIFLYNSTQNDLELTVEKRFDVPIGTRLQMGESMAGRVAQSRQPLILDDYRTWEHRAAIYAGSAHSSVVEVPMAYGGELIGVIGVSEIGETSRKFTDADANLLTLLAGQAANAVHNARLFQETRVRAEQLALLYDAGLALNSVLDPRVQLEFLLQIAMKALNAERAEFFRFDASSGRLSSELNLGYDDKHAEEAKTRLQFSIEDENTTVSWIANHRAPLNLSDVRLDPRWVTVDPAIRSGLWAPVLHENQLHGVLGILSTRLKAFTPQDERLLVLFANQVAVAMENARLFDETRQRLVELEAVNRMSSALRASRTIDEMAPILLDEVLAVLGTTAGEIVFYDALSAEMRVAVARGWFQQMPRISPADDGIAGLVLKASQPYVTREFRPDPNISELARLQIPEGWGGAIVPIRTAQETIGVLMVSVKLPRELTSNEIRLLTTLTEIAGNVIHRAALNEQTEQRLRCLDALHIIDKAIGASLDLRVTLNVFLDQVTTQLRVDAADVLRLNPSTQVLEYAAGRGFKTPAIERTRVRVGQDYAGRAALERRDIQIPNLLEAGAAANFLELVVREGFVAYYAAPLIAKGQIKGVLEIFHRTALRPDAEWVDFVGTLAEQAAIAIDNATLFDGLQRSNFDISLAYDATIEGWARALDLRGQEVQGHTQRVTEMALRLARAMGMSDAELVHVRRGALLHDIGKMGIPDSILLKRDALTGQEEEVMRRHPALAYELLSPVAFLRPAMDIPYCHHEKWDGTGYPQRLKSDQIPLTARVFAVADAWDELRSDRPGCAAVTEEQARQFIREQSGKHFDPAVVKVFLKIIGEQPAR